MPDFKKVIIPIIRTPEQKKFQEATKDARVPEVLEHDALMKEMSSDELEERRVHFFDRWCWETGDSTHLMISEMYAHALRIREMMSVQPMPGPVAGVKSLKFTYKRTEPEDDA
jgi:hypothetical protein